MPKTLPNIILIVMDTLGARHLAWHGCPRSTAPFLEQLAASCRVYTRCFSPSCWTLPAHASLFTGLYPGGHGVHESNFYLADEFGHLAHLLRQAGYRTYGFSSNFLVAPVTGIGRHFDLFQDYGKSEEEVFGEAGGVNPKRQEFLHQMSMQGLSAAKVKFFCRYVLENRDWPILKTYLRRYYRKIAGAADPQTDSGPYTIRSLQEGLDTIRRHRRLHPDRPYFLFFNLMEPHHYYNPPVKARIFSAPGDKQTFLGNFFYDPQRLQSSGHLLPSWINLYQDEIHYLDTLLADFYRSLQQEGLLDRTALLFTSDHGEHFGEKGHFEHRLSLYNELLWVPLLVQFPRSLAAPGVSDRLTSLNDLFSTILDLAESPWPRPYTSSSLLSGEAPAAVASMIMDSSPWKRRMTADFGHDPSWLEGRRLHRFALMLAEGWKLIEGEDGALEIYHLARDPWEEQDLWDSLPAAVRTDFQQLLEVRRAELLPASGAPPAPSQEQAVRWNLG